MSDTNFHGSSWLSGFARRRSNSLASLLNASGKTKKKTTSRKSGGDALTSPLSNQPFMLQDLENRVMLAAFTWDGSASADWSTGANWDKGTVPGADDEAIFPIGAANIAVTLSKDVEIDSINFTGTGYSISSASGTKTLLIDSDHDDAARGIYSKFSGTGTNTVAVTVDLNDDVSVGA